MERHTLPSVFRQVKTELKETHDDWTTSLRAVNKHKVVLLSIKLNFIIFFIGKHCT